MDLKCVVVSVGADVVFTEDKGDDTGVDEDGVEGLDGDGVEELYKDLDIAMHAGKAPKIMLTRLIEDDDA